MDILFKAVKEAHDGKARIVFICADPYGFYVYKPTTGFRSKHWESRQNKALISCFKRQISCTQNAGFFEPGEAPAAKEVYSLKAPAKPKAKAPAQKVPVVTEVAEKATTETTEPKA